MSTRFLEQVLTGGAGVHKTGRDAHHLGLTLGGALGRYTKELPDQSCVYISGAGWVLFTHHLSFARLLTACTVPARVFDNPGVSGEEGQPLF